MKLIDSATIETLRELDPDPEFLRSLIDAYSSDTLKKMLGLDAAMASADFAEAASIAHFMKSSSAGLGALVLSDLFTQLETEAKSGKFELRFSDIEYCSRQTLEELCQLRP